ncbi:type III restriction-modification system endonuclease [Desulfovibrio falkowii]|uniref:type III restriction-modification system endonuclease n=1 Tax=Desulfovibrio sp. WGS1351 TaxID=3366814 RepID=UPI00372D0A6A
MKLKFKQQDFQDDAVNAVADLFTGQEKQTTTFSIVNGLQPTLLENQFGIGNARLVDDASLLANMHEIQKRNSLPLTDDAASMQFCVEMETGTGKTYVYTKTIFELYRRYGFTKFIIVVPSVAIREGVYKSLQVTEEHFSLQYDNAPCRYFIYNSARLSDVRQFAVSANIEIMIINIDAFKKAENVINQAQDKLNGETAMRYIQDTRPIVIIDEPQSVDNTPKSKEAIASLNPLCVLRYSATHREKLNLLYRLTPVDAYQMGLVKQICVSSNQVAHSFNKPYIKLLSVSSDKGFKAKIEMDVAGKDGKVSRKPVTVKPGADLFMLSGERELYEGYTVAGIDCTPDYEGIEFDNTEFLKLGQAIGDIDQNLVRRAQIRRTIEAHFDKELRYHDKGIKVLSLFFIDEVKKYRTEDGGPGIYAEMFEECYRELLERPKYAPLKERFSTTVDKVHDGYFSQDRKGNYKNTKGDTLDDYDTYNTIMKDKEWLLSFDCPLRFIFSHSALKEGWDNPNVFQVCTLIEQKSVFTARQKVGRGLRLCVNQNGERVEDKNINLLHVMANESFAEFAATLQKEIETDTGVRFGLLQISLFQGMVFTDKTEQARTISSEEAEQIVAHLKKQGYISDQGQALPALQTAVEQDKPELPAELVRELPKEAVAARVEVAKVIASVIAKAAPVTAAALAGVSYTRTVETEKTVSYDDAKELMGHFEQKGYVSKSGAIKDTMKNALKNGTLDLPKKFEAARARFEQIIANADRRPPIRDASKDVSVKLNKQAMLSPEFMELWNKIKQKTTYRVAVDTDLLISLCVKDLREMDPIPKARIVSQSADIHIEAAGVSHTEREIRTTEIQEDYSVIPDVLAVIGEQTLTKRSTVRDILVQSGRLQDLLNNPQLFIERCVEVIKGRRHELAVDGVSYLQLAGEEYYVQEIFDSTELIANLDKNAVAVEHSVYDHIIYDSDTVELPFAVALDNDPDVRMFFKIPKKFTIETPIGTYNPDWAVYLDCDGMKKLYFVLETKGDLNLFNLRGKEKLKIHCGRQHFKALDNGVELRVARDWKEFRTKL